MYKRSGPAKQHVAESGENGRKALSCSVFIMIIINIYLIIFVSFTCT